MAVIDEKKYISVSKFTDILKKTIETNFSYIFLKGEISNIRPSSSGIVYLVLKDSDASVRGIIFRNNQLAINRALREYGIKNLENGQKVLIEGRVNLYKKGGDYSVIIERVIPVGAGDLFVKFELLKKKLESEGLFDSSIKKTLPKFPESIGIVTSPTGAALQDILNVLKRRFTAVNIIVFPAAVQGDNAKYEIAKAVKCADFHFKNNTSKKTDVLILARGGGSIEDLWAFNEEEVAYAIYNSSIPIITGIGHEIDFTIADFCADMRAPTPSAAAEIAVKNKEELINTVGAYRLRLTSSFNSKIENFYYKFANVNKEKLSLIIQRKYRELMQEHSYCKDKLIAAMNRKVQMMRQKFLVDTQKLDDLSPLNVLKRGYSLVYKEDGKVVKSYENISENEKINIKLSKGTLKAVVEEIKSI